MTNAELYEAMIQKTRDAVLVALELHDEDCADEKCVEPVNVVAYFAHSLGLKPEHMELVKAFLVKKQIEHDEHEKTCTDPKHKH